MSTSTNSFLKSQRKAELLSLAEEVGLKKINGMKKTELELALDDHLSDNLSYASHPKAAPFYESRSRAIGSPLKKDLTSGEPRKRRGAATVVKQAITASADDDSGFLLVPSASSTPAASAQLLARRISLPSTPAEIARVVDESTMVVRDSISSLYAESGINDFVFHTRDFLSTVSSIIFGISTFELYFLRKEILADRYIFTVPAISALHTADHIVEIPDLFLLLQGSFWSPFLLWLATSVIVPITFGFYFNLSAAHAPPRSRREGSAPVFTVDPLAFSIAKAVITYVVYEQGVDFGGWVSQEAVARINSAVWGGWKGVLTGTLITGVASIYDAALRRQ